mgnify:CR=1 FL=1
MTVYDRLQFLCHTIATQHQHPVLWCSAGKHSLILLHLWQNAGLTATVLFNELDMGFPGVREHLEECCHAWGVEDVRVVHPAITFDAYVEQQGYPVEHIPPDLPEGVRVSNSWQCTFMRQSTPLLVASLVMGADAIVTGIRAEDHPLMAAMGPGIDASETWGITRYNPLYDWSTADVWTYIDEHGIPLPDQYPLKREATYVWPDCLPCTRRPEHWTMLKEQHPEVYARYWPTVSVIVGGE